MYRHLIHIIFISNVLAQSMGPAKLTIQKFEKCSKGSAGINSKLTLNKYNSTHDAIDFYISTPNIGLDPSVNINATISKLENGAWRPHLLDVFELYACENFFMRHFREKFTRLLKRLKLPERCPVPPGTYELKNLIFDGKASMPLEYGEFKGEMRLQRGTEILTCTRFFAKSSPRKE